MSRLPLIGAFIQLIVVWGSLARIEHGFFISDRIKEEAAPDALLKESGPPLPTPEGLLGGFVCSPLNRAVRQAHAAIVGRTKKRGRWAISSPPSHHTAAPFTPRIYLTLYLRQRVIFGYAAQEEGMPTRMGKSDLVGLAQMRESRPSGTILMLYPR